MRILSLYCGAGGIDEGLRQAGFKTTVAVDVWKDACETFKLNHPDTEVINKSVGEIKSTFGEFDMVVGGPPCQTFSYNNPNRKNDLTEVNTFIEIIETIKPKYYIMENVRGLFNILDWGMKKLIDMKNFGVPQTRKRVIFTNLNYPNTIIIRNVKDVIDTTGFKYIFKSGNTHQNRKVRTKSVDGLCDTATASDKMFLTNHEIISEKYGFNFDVPKQELNIEQHASLQGFPLYYKWYGGKTSIRRQIGNAVPPPLIKAFGEMI